MHVPEMKAKTGVYDHAEFGAILMQICAQIS
jgi:hypothetical protein